jgi:SAM-dependent methyltransferase
MLHVAPEKCFESILRGRLGDGYIAADIAASDGVIKMDITNIDWPDQSFDVIYCSHVLEHVQDDRKAMSEMRRTLKSNGWAIMQVPIGIKETFEDPVIVDPEEKGKVFGHRDHVRKYGEDFAARLNDAGFQVMAIKGDDFISENDILRMRLTGASGSIYFCRQKQDQVKK